MKYKVGDEVLLKAKVKDLHVDGHFCIEAKNGVYGWVAESEIQSIEKQFPREMWVWNPEQRRQKAKVFYVFDSINDPKKHLPVVAENENGTLCWYKNYAEIEPITLSLDEAKKIIAEVKGVDVSEVTIAS